MRCATRASNGPNHLGFVRPPGVNCAANPSQCGSGSGDAGYQDNTACYTTIHAPAGETVIFTFTQLNLELQGCHPSQPNGGCPDGGCDFVSVFDGQGADAPLIGKYSGYQTGASLPSVVSTQEYLRVEFHTDARNCGASPGTQTQHTTLVMFCMSWFPDFEFRGYTGISAAEDPGWFADWAFVEDGAGEEHCFPCAPAVTWSKPDAFPHGAAGQNICAPDSAVLRSRHGVIHDDDVSTAGSYGTGGTQVQASTTSNERQAFWL